MNILNLKVSLLLCWVLGHHLFLFGQQEKADQKRISRLIDSAQVYRYRDFDKVFEFLDEVDDLIGDENSSYGIRQKLNSNQIRISTALYLSHLQTCEDLINLTDELVERHKKTLDSAYSFYKGDNEYSRALLYYVTSDLEKAMSALSVSLKHFRSLPLSHDNCEKLYVVNETMALVQNLRGETDAAINQYKASIPYFECSQSPEGFKSLIYQQIAKAYISKKEYSYAKEYIEIAQRVLTEAVRQDPPQFASIAISLNETLESYYQATGQHEKSLTLFKEALKLLPFSEPQTGRVYLGLGRTYNAVGNKAAAIEYYNMAEAFLLRKSGSKDAYLPKVYNGLGQILMKDADFDRALAYFQKAIISSIIDFEDQHSDPKLEKIVLKSELLKSLRNKYEALLGKYGLSSDTSLLYRAFKTNKLAVALLDTMANEIGLDRDKITFSEQSYEIYEDGVRLAYGLYANTSKEFFFDECFQLIDKSKSMVLLENLRLVNKFGGISSEWLDLERKLKSELQEIEKSLYKKESEKNETTELISIRQRYAETKNKYHALIGQIKKEAKPYYDLLFDRHVILPAFIQNEVLRPEEALVEFFVGDSTVTLLGLTNKTRFLSQKRSPDLQGQVSRLRKQITEEESQGDPAALDHASIDLCSLLLNEFLETVGDGISTLIIIPDGALGYIPFEVLKRKALNRKPKYLLENYAIRYAYSSSYLYEQNQRKNTASEFLGGFVASGESTTYKKLGGARQEVESIAELVGTGAVTFDPATKDDFLKHAPKFRILHLAMHSVVNDQHPMLSQIIFSPQKDSTKEQALTAIELYGMQLEADLVILSACNTGFGELRRGEGIMSISRAFAFSGVPSAVISLWQVPDKATSKLMVEFYQHLKSGNSKADALRLAKLSFVEKYPAMSQPFYWSGFIVMGNNDPIRFPNSRAWLVIIVCLATGALVFVSWRKLKYR